MKLIFRRLPVLTLVLVISFFMSGCFGDESVDSPGEHHATFKANGVEKDLKIFDSVGIQSYGSDWQGVWDEENVLGGDLSDNYLVLLLPKSAVYTGSSFNITGGTTCLLLDGVVYANNISFTITITQWGTVGELGKGTFYGTVENDSGDLLTITDGVFEAVIDPDI
jgi:hypothetical protein